MCFNNKINEEEDDLELAQNEQETPKEVSFWKLISQEPREHLKRVIGTFFAILSGTTLPALSLLLGQMLTSMQSLASKPDELKNRIDILAIIFLCFGVGSLLFLYLGNFCWAISGEKTAKKIRDRYFRALLKQEIAYFDQNTSGTVSSTLNADITLIQDGISEKIANLINQISSAVVSLGVAFYFGWKMTLVLLAVTPLLGLSGALQSRFITNATQKGLKKNAKANEVTCETVGGVRTVYSFVSETLLAQRHWRHLTEASNTNIKNAHLMALGLAVVAFFRFGMHAFGMWYGGKLILEGEMDIGAVLTVFFSIIFGGMAVGTASQIFPDIAKAKGAAAGIFSILERDPLIDANEGNGVTLPSLDGKLSFKNVCFSYPTRPETKVLRKLNMEINPGQKVALVGPSGSGKSTIIQLLERFYDPIKGSIMIDGVDLKSLDLKYYRRNLGLVSQEPILFAGTIFENILFGNPQASQEEVESAAKMANAYDFIMNQPDGFSTLVGEKGTQLSGGQKQRIAIARAILKNPKILLLDEATSALDTESERLVQSALDNLMQDRTTIIIAHRLSTVRNADVICVMMDGKIVEQGTHDQLIVLNGVYSNLVSKQLASNEEKILKKESKMKESQAKMSQSNASIIRESENSSAPVKNSRREMKRSELSEVKTEL
jgi:ATP-binding cassette subfamily B (MDR/TAP) protein 1